jgi:uncharacterized protein (TIGR02001 family)
MSCTRLHRSVHKLCLAAAALAASACGHVHAQGLGGTVSVQSDARFRGVSYSDEKPNAQATLTFDGSGGTAGWYGGALITRVHFGPQRQNTMLQGYAGRVFGLSAGLDAEAGVQLNHFKGVTRYNYGEAYVGLLAERWNARLYASNDYYGTQQRSLYAELNVNWPLALLGPSVQAFAHAGVIDARGGAYAPHSSRADWRTGVAWRYGAAELQLAWVGVGSGGPYTWTSDEHRRTWVLGLSAAF